MPQPRALGLFTALVLAVGPTAVLAVPASAAAPERTRMVGSSTHELGRYNDGIDRHSRVAHVVRYQGRLRTAAGDVLAGVPVSLERRLASEAAYKVIDTKATGRRGRAGFSTEVAGNARYRVTFAGNATHAASSSGSMRLAAMRDLNARMVEKGERVFLRGNINPGWKNRKVTWQRKACGTCGWKTRDTSGSGATGGWKFRAAYPALGKVWRFRAKIAATDDFAASTSTILRTRTVRARGSSGELASLG